MLGSVKVSNTLAFTGSDTAAAEAARDSVATALSSSDSTADYFGNTFGEVSVSDLKTVTTSNPTGMSTPKSPVRTSLHHFAYSTYLTIDFGCSKKWRYRT